MVDTARRPKVLLVEDAEDNAFVLEHVLGREFDVSVARGAAQALALASATPYEIAVIDLWLPVHSGMWVIAELRKIPHCAGIRSLAISADIGASAGPDFAEAKFDAFLIKPPPSLEALRVAVRALVPVRD